MKRTDKGEQRRSADHEFIKSFIYKTRCASKTTSSYPRSITEEPGEEIPGLPRDTRAV